jgi:hypothetical protein
VGYHLVAAPTLVQAGLSPAPGLVNGYARARGAPPSSPGAAYRHWPMHHDSIMSTGILILRPSQPTLPLPPCVCVAHPTLSICSASISFTCSCTSSTPRTACSLSDQQPFSVAAVNCLRFLGEAQIRALAQDANPQSIYPHPATSISPSITNPAFRTLSCSTLLATAHSPQPFSLHRWRRHLRHLQWTSTSAVVNSPTLSA